MTEATPKKRRVRCPKCKSPDIWFDAHAGFAICHNCGFDTQKCGPDPCYASEDEQPKQEIMPND